MPLELQPRDLEIIRFVYAHRVASYSQIWRKFFPEKTIGTISPRLKKLIKGGFLRSAFQAINGGHAERYFLPCENAFEIVRHHWGFEIDKPHYKSESIVHDLHLTELAMRLEKLKQFKKLLPENLLQSSSTLTDDPFLGDLVRAQSDGALYITGLSGRGYLFALELELSDKSIERNKSKLSAYYFAKGVQGVLYFCSDESVIGPLSKADAEVRKDKNSIVYFALESEALCDSDKITLRNAKGGSFDMT